MNPYNTNKTKPPKTLKQLYEDLKFPLEFLKVPCEMNGNHFLLFSAQKSIDLP